MLYSCINRARGGDPNATQDLIEALRPRISKMALYYGRCSGEDPDDLLQEAWVGLLEALPTLDMHIGSPEQHLIARARWKLLDAIKYARVRRCVPLDDAVSESLCGADSESMASEVIVSEFAGNLRPVHRRIVDCLIAGLTWREVGQVLGCTSANVCYHVRQIRRCYAEWAGNADHIQQSADKVKEINDNLANRDQSDGSAGRERSISVFC